MTFIENFFHLLAHIFSSDHPTMMTEGHGDECVVHGLLDFKV